MVPFCGFIPDMVRTRSLSLCRDLLEDVEWILHRHAPHAAEAGLRAQLTHLGLGYACGAQPFTVMRSLKTKDSPILKGLQFYHNFWP